MSMTVNFRGGETAGGVADRKIETAKQETTGGVGVKQKQDSIFVTDSEAKCDTVCFRGKEYGYAEPKKETSALGTITGIAAAAAVTIGLLGLAHKYDAVNKYIKNDKVKNLFKNADKITEPCYKACQWVKNNSYDKIANYLKK